MFHKQHPVSLEKLPMPIELRISSSPVLKSSEALIPTSRLVYKETAAAAVAALAALIGTSSPRGDDGRPTPQRPVPGMSHFRPDKSSHRSGSSTSSSSSSVYTAGIPQAQIILKQQTMSKKKKKKEKSYISRVQFLYSLRMCNDKPPRYYVSGPEDEGKTNNDGRVGSALLFFSSSDVAQQPLTIVATSQIDSPLPIGNSDTLRSGRTETTQLSCNRDVACPVTVSPTLRKRVSIEWSGVERLPPIGRTVGHTCGHTRGQTDSQPAHHGCLDGAKLRAAAPTAPSWINRSEFAARTLNLLAVHSYSIKKMVKEEEEERRTQHPGLIFMLGRDTITLDSVHSTPRHLVENQGKETDDAAPLH
ncbi:hypothetical protein DAPPUDRAFT_238184 [Daphnia pulex]|uniref:Uncharacterized protein n=1 Tax=Daphnia pulex TaxID=6669 RepID=E9G6V2_DAPPU|nr:hypothetical protein DAPPUDRAFT_238184 [Daphnia pulex]|eukprot:EFX85128.1 hypothetical protein DAPPUDRAFT_238184 [Daphnia pulex]